MVHDDLAASLPQDPLGLAIREFTVSYNALRFGGSVAAAPRLSSLLDEISQQAARRR